jgi:hypothetical protein
VKPVPGARKGGSTKKGEGGGNKHKNARAESGEGSAGVGSASGGSSGAVPAALQAMICARDEANAELDRERAHVAEAMAAVERTRAELQAAEAAKRKQGEKVDASMAQVSGRPAVAPVKRSLDDQEHVWASSPPWPFRGMGQHAPCRAPNIDRQ